MIQEGSLSHKYGCQKCIWERTVAMRGVIIRLRPDTCEWSALHTSMAVREYLYNSMELSLNQVLGDCSVKSLWSDTT